MDQKDRDWFEEIKRKIKANSKDDKQDDVSGINTSVSDMNKANTSAGMPDKTPKDSNAEISRSQAEQRTAVSSEYDLTKDSKNTEVENEYKVNFEETKNKQKKEKKFKNTYIYGFIFIIFSIIFEIANFLTLGMGMLPSAFGVEFAIIVILAGIIFIIPSEPAKIALTSIFLGVQMIMNIANASMYKMMYDVITVDMIFTLGFETMDAFELNQLNILSLVINLAITALYILAIVFGNKFMPKCRMKKGKSAVISLITLLIMVEVFGVSSLLLSKKAYFATAEDAYIMDDGEFIYNTMSSKWATLKKYGFWSFYINNSRVFFNYEKNISDKDYDKLRKFVDDGANFKYENSLFNGENISGKLAGDNLIMIMMESIEWFAIDPYNTPNLYEFVNNDALCFTNYYSRNKTNISEQISVLGSIVNDYSLNTINNKVGLSTSHSLPKMFKNSGYESVNFFHDYTGKMYDREHLNVQIGFDNVYAMEQSTIEDKSKYFGDFLDDGEYIKSMASKFMPTDKSFFSFFTTVTSHGPYEKSNDRYEGYYNRFDSNYENFCNYVEANNLGYTTPEAGSRQYSILKEYKAKAMAVDNAIGYIKTYLKTHTDKNGNNLWSNTNIVIFADHNAYYSELGYMMKNIGKYENNKEIYRIPLAIYSSKLGNGKINTFCNTYDIYPTICDLYGITYNKSLTHGYSVFSNEISKSVFVSTMVGAFNDSFYTVDYVNYTAIDNEIDTYAKLNNFKKELDKFLRDQNLIEMYYRINYESYNK